MASFQKSLTLWCFIILTEALQIARNQCSRAPTDADAHSMSLALLFSSRKTSKKSPVSNEEIMQRCTFVLQTNCGDSSRAVQGWLFLFYYLYVVLRTTNELTSILFIHH